MAGKLATEEAGLIEQTLWVLFSGITLGCIYAFVALGFVIVYSMTKMFNLCAGEFVMLGAILAGIFYGFGFPLFLSIALSLIICGAIGAITWLVFLHHPYSSGASPLTLLLVIAALAIVSMGSAYMIWGTAPRSLPEFTHLKLVVAGVTIPPQFLWVWGVTALAVGFLFFLLDRTLVGKAFRACSENPVAARLMGINPNFMAFLSFVLAAMLGGIAGVISAPVTTASYAMGLGMTIKGCLAAMLGGIDRAQGAIIGGLILGLAESFAGGFISTEFMEAIALGLLIAILLFRHEGIFGIREEKFCRK